MRKLILEALCLSMAASATFADDVLPPSWRGANNTVWAEWDRWDNYGIDPANVTPDSWRSRPEGLSPSPVGSLLPDTTDFLAAYGGKLDVIQATGDDGRTDLRFWLPDLPAGEGAEVWVQMTYLLAGGRPRHFFSIGWSGTASYLGITDQGSLDHGNGWLTEAWSIEFDGTPARLRVGWHRFDAYPAYVDQVVMDARTVPEPTVLLSTMLGGLVLLRSRRKGGTRRARSLSSQKLYRTTLITWKRKTMPYQVLIAAAMFLTTVSVPTYGSLLVVTSGSGAFGYGTESCRMMTGALDTATGGQVTTVPDLENLEQILGSDSLWVDVCCRSPRALSDTEAVNLATFVSTGRRVVMVGENNMFWRTWNDGILEVAGGANSGGSTPGGGTRVITSTILAYELTSEVDRVSVICAGLATGGDPLFDRNWATLWHEGTVVTLLDVNFMMDENWGLDDNGRFVVNLANWIAVPEPTTAGLLAAATPFLLRRRRRTKGVE